MPTKRTQNTDTPPSPPADLAARCRATIPVAPHVDRQSTLRRVLLASVTLALVLGVGELARRPLPTQQTALPSDGVAFAETVAAMQRVTFFHRTGTGLDFETVPHWKYLSTKYANDEWFDVQRGLYERTHQSARMTAGSLVGDRDYGALTLPQGLLYVRSGTDVMIHDHSERARWSDVKRDKRREITEPALFGGGVGSNLEPGQAPIPTPTASRPATWRGRRMICFSFVAAPLKEKIEPQRTRSPVAAEVHRLSHELWQMAVPDNAPTLRAEVYVDPGSRRICAVQKYARFPTHPEIPERLACEYAYDYDHRPDSSLFRPQTILAGAREISDFRESRNEYVPRTVRRLRGK